MTRRLAAALVFVVAACSGDPGAGSDGSAPVVAEAPTTIPANAPTATTLARLTTTAAPTTVVSTTAVDPGPPMTTVPPTVPAAVCRPPGGSVSTASGRRVLLRADGLAGPSPTIIVIHGYTGTPEGIERFAELTAVANGRGVAVAYPEGTPVADGFGWNTGASVFATEAGDDVRALAEMIDAMVATGCVDPAHLILSGESNGGGMALLAACSAELASRIARVVLVNAAVDAGVLARCSGGAGPRALTAVAGARDETVPLDGGGRLLPVSEWFAAASSLIGGCAAVEPAAPLDAFVARTIGTGCEACTELLVIADGTHTWPGTTRGVSGLDPGSFDLNTRLVEAARTPQHDCLS